MSREMEANKIEHGSRILTLTEHLFMRCKGKGYKSLAVKSLESSFELMDTYFKVGHSSCLTLVPIIYSSAMGMGQMEVSDINKWLECPLSNMGTLHDSLGNLLRVGLITKSYDRNEIPKYALKQKTLHCLLKNKAIPSLQTQEKSLSSFLEQLSNLLESFESDEIEEGLFYSQADLLLEDFSSIKELSTIRDLDLTTQDRYLFLLVVTECILNEKSGADVDEIMKKLCFSTIRRKKASDALLKKKHPLIQKKLLAFTYGNYISVEWMILGDYASQIFLGEENVDKRKLIPTRGVLIKPDSSNEQTLFYNNKEKETLDRILHSLSPEGLKDLFAQYKRKNQPESLTVLLQGGPGVGKTSSVYDLARKTGRIVYQVEIDKIHDMFVGESEKNVAKIFSEYEILKSEQDQCPILLLNECDNLLKSRINHERSSVDQMANNLTTLMLEKMENFSGILFSTINQIHFDEAFYRRFLYKIEINKPVPETRLQILLHLFPDIDRGLASIISERYNLTGANIGNLQRKYIVLSMSDKDVKIDDCIEDLCREELFIQSDRVVISGFQFKRAKLI